MTAFDPEEKQFRDDLLKRFDGLEARLYPTDGSEPPAVKESARIREDQKKILRSPKT